MLQSMGLRMIVLRLEQRRHESAMAAYVHLGFTRFLYYYARGHYADAGVWSRRLAEAFCINVLQKKYAAQGTRHVSMYPLLGGMVYDLPHSISWPRAYDLCEEGKDTATYLGCHLSVATVWDDLERMRRYGNNGAHAHSYFTGPPTADPSVFIATLRIALATLELQPMASL